MNLKAIVTCVYNQFWIVVFFCYVVTPSNVLGGKYLIVKLILEETKCQVLLYSLGSEVLQ